MKLDIIIPVKNQTSKLLNHLENEGIPYFDKMGIAYDVLIVPSNSTEAEQNALVEGVKKLPLQVKLLPYEEAPGKDRAVKRGILASDGDYVMFMDADFATDVRTLDEILPIVNKYDCFIASRHSKGSNIVVKQSFIRRITSWGSRFIIRNMFHFKGIHDTQCGFKLFRKDVAQEMAKRQIIEYWAADVEYLYFLKLNGFTVKEIPTSWTDDPASSIKSPLKVSWKFYKELRQIKKNKKNYYLDEETKKMLTSKK